MSACHARERSAIWLAELWNDDARAAHVRLPKNVYLCSTAGGASRVVDGLTDRLLPHVVDRDDVSARVARGLRGDPPKLLSAVLEWTSQVAQTTLVAHDGGGGRLDSLWQAGGGLERPVQVALDEARRLFREHGAAIVLDYTCLMSVALLVHPDTQYHDKLFSARTEPVSPGAAAGAAAPTVAPAAAPAAAPTVAAAVDPVEERVRVALAAAEAAIDAMGDDDWPAVS